MDNFKKSNKMKRQEKRINLIFNKKYDIIYIES